MQYSYLNHEFPEDFDIDPKIEEEIFFTRINYTTCTECDGEGRVEIYKDVYQQMTLNPSSIVLTSVLDYIPCPKCIPAQSKSNFKNQDYDEESFSIF